MRIGIFADTHDHMDNIRLAVEYFNRAECEYVLFAGDLVSTFVIPPLRKLNCPMIACFGDNEGNKPGIYAGFSIIGTIAEAPLCIRLPDGTRILMSHMRQQMQGMHGEYDLLIFGHTHKPVVKLEESGRMQVNPGETSGWTYGRSTIAMLETESMSAEIIDLVKPHD
ncbi:MAG: putative phosphoesterase [Pirellulaceae bacterium]|jgi:putative phosphoesterase